LTAGLSQHRARAPEPVVVRVVPVSDPATLRHLAAAIEMQDPRPRAVARLADEKLAELATMVVTGRTPTLGWWRQALGVDEGIAAARAELARLRSEWNAL
jgi:hypothetical protein